jgi:iron complex outermembrane receptor protein
LKNRRRRGFFKPVTEMQQRRNQIFTFNLYDSIIPHLRWSVAFSPTKQPTQAAPLNFIGFLLWRIIVIHSLSSRRTRLLQLAVSVLVVVFGSFGYAQGAGSKLSGTVVDGQGKAIGNALVTIKSEKTTKTTRVNANGTFSFDGLPAGTYMVEADAAGFSSRSKVGVTLAVDQAQEIDPLTLSIASVAEQITVNSGIDSVAAETAPSGGFVEERSAQSLISDTYVENFTSPIADYGEIVQIVPGTFTLSSDGIGLGQSKTYFRGFPDGDFDIDFDGVPFYDTNSPTHHSWAFFPAQWIGGVDFDRSPGSASTIGPTPFGGSIHLLSKPMGNEQDIRGTASYGTWNTKLFDGAYNSGSFGLFGGPKRSTLFVDVHHMTVHCCISIPFRRVRC